ncbi:hypothetical protein [Bradyrhizobium sp. CW11]|uniref:hypothetical protein n=1 Tax=Bradyrhizobium sp. CW11 TaxID=2782684 RepID=UPI001FF78EC0|nr:hypothetical protein [Bradyrhizobium sp. CW11]MCK1348631.1 Mov34/MPN/PAD-1 family protein [Bradyrhizobium sp. CW11]
MTNTVHVEKTHIQQTLDHLRAAGRRNAECVVLWLAEEAADRAKVVRQVYRPEQWAREDIFRIAPAEMRQIIRLISDRGWMIAAQAHSHPREAFHSPADDKWAIVRHRGALSLVLPHFASRSTVENFFEHTATFCLDSCNRWNEVDTKGINEWLHVN